MIRVYLLEVGGLRRQMEKGVPALSGWDRLTDWQREKISRCAFPGAAALCMGGQLLLQYGAYVWSSRAALRQGRLHGQQADLRDGIEEAAYMKMPERESAISEEGISWSVPDLARICRTVPAPQPLQAACEARGKPYILHVPWHYNLSHSGDYAALAISDAPVGIDIQQMRPYRDSLVKRFFSDEEAAAYEKLVCAETRDQGTPGGPNAVEVRRGDTAGAALFYTLWCRKEAYGKLLGTGLTEKVLKCNMLGDIHARLYESRELSGYRICVCAGATINPCSAEILLS